MVKDGGQRSSLRDLRGLRVLRVGAVVETDEPGVPFTITDATGAPVEPVTEFIRELATGDLTASSCRSYAHDLLRWWRFLAAVGVAWDQAQRVEVRDLVRWLRQAANPQRQRRRPDAPAPGSINRRTGKRYLALGYAPATINLPPAGRGAERPNAHGNPMRPPRPHRRASYRQHVPERLRAA